MYAIVNIAGQQYKVEKDQKLFVHRLVEKEGESVSFDEVLLIDNDKSVVVGEPTIQGAMISGKVISHPKGDKVKVFKKKRRKGYKVRTGHRQYLTEIQIEDIIEKGAVKGTKTTTKIPEATKASPAAKKPATTAVKTEAAKTATAKEEKPASKTAAPKTETKKPAAKKPAAKKPASTKAAAAKPVAKKPATTKAAVKKSAAAKPATKKPAAKKPDAGKESKK